MIEKSNRSNVFKKIKIVNVVISAKLDHEIDLERIVKTIPKTLYEPSIFSGLVYRKLNPKSTIIMFKSGSITSVGSKSEEEGRESLNQTAFEISQKAESRYKVKNIKTVNIIALISIGQKINLEKILLKIQNVKYNRHVFAGAVVQLHENKLLVFNTGKIISVGCKSKEKAKASIYEMCNLLKQNKIII